MAGSLLIAAAATATIHLLGIQGNDSTFFIYKLPSGSLFFAESFDHPELARLRAEERLDDVVKEKKDELDGLIRLADWSSNLFEPTSPFPNYPAWNARVILDLIRAGETGGFCAQYAFVFGQACQSLGYVVRYHDIGKEFGGSGHFLPEVYVPSQKKWIAFEPQYGHIYKNRQNEFLGVIELSDYANGRRRGDVFKHPQNERVLPDRLDLFRLFRFYLRNNFISSPVHVGFADDGDRRRFIFEPYRLAYAGNDTSRINEIGREALLSSNREDFLHALDPIAIEKIRFNSKKDFQRAMKEFPPLQLYEVTLPERIYSATIRQFAENRPIYKLLIRSLDSD